MEGVSSDSDAITFDRSIRLDAFTLGMSIILCTIATLTIVDGGDAHEIFSFLPFDLAAWGWLAMFAWAGSRALRNILDRRPRLVLSAEGLLTRMPMGGELVLAWREIRDVRYPGFGSIAIEVRDLKAVRSRLAPVGRFWTRVNSCTGGAPLTINGLLLGSPTPDVVAAIRERLERRMLAEVREIVGPTEAESRGES